MAVGFSVLFFLSVDPHRTVMALMSMTMERNTLVNGRTERGMARASIPGSRVRTTANGGMESGTAKVRTVAMPVGAIANMLVGGRMVNTMDLESTLGKMKEDRGSMRANGRTAGQMAKEA